jgi:hypothetical protein
MAKKESTTSGQVAPTAPSLPPFPAFSQTPLGQRMAMMSSGADGSLPVWANGGNLTNFDPGAVPLSTTPPTSSAPSPYGPVPPAASTPREQAAPAVSTGQSPWAAANPLARPGEPPRLGDDIRSDIFRQIYRTGKRSDTPAGPMLMNIGKPSVPQADPLAALNPATEPESPPRYLDASGNTAPPAGNILPSNSYGAGPSSGPAGAVRGAGPAGRLAARMRTGGGQGQMAPPGVAGTTPRGPQFSQLPAPRGPNRTGQRRSTTTPRRSLLRRP